MKTKIINKGRGYWQLVSDEDKYLINREPLILMSICNFIDNRCYRIQDFRYSKDKEPNCCGDDYSQWHTLIVSDEVNKIIIPIIKNMKGFVFSKFEFNEKENYYSWHDNDGIVFDGCDRPFDKQNKKYANLVNPHWIWSYRAAKKKMKEAKDFWSSFNGTWTESKISNPYLMPSGLEMRLKLKEKGKIIRIIKIKSIKKKESKSERFNKKH